MPRRKNSETPEQQSAMLRAEVERLIAAGELSPIEAEEALDQLVRKSATDGASD